MNKYTLLVILMLNGFLPARADTPTEGCFVAAIEFAKQQPVPATLKFSNRDGKNMLEVHLNGKTWIAPVVVRDVPKSAREKMYDAVFVSKDGLSSITITGQFYYFSAGDGIGQIVIHTAANISNESVLPTPASLVTGRFAVAKLNTEQAGADQPTSKPADKAPASAEPPTRTSKDAPR